MLSVFKRIRIPEVLGVLSSLGSIFYKKKKWGSEGLDGARASLLRRQPSNHQLPIVSRPGQSCLVRVGLTNSHAIAKQNNHDFGSNNDFPVFTKGPVPGPHCSVHLRDQLSSSRRSALLS